MTCFRSDPPKGLGRSLLLKAIACRIQENAFGGYDKATLRILKAYGCNRPSDERHQWLKAGTVLVREYRGIRHAVTIVPEGYVWRENTYPSLTLISQLITGIKWNGPRFFGLRQAKGGNAGQAQEKAL